jgi:vitamin B12 transporter
MSSLVVVTKSVDLAVTRGDMNATATQRKRQIVAPLSVYRTLSAAAVGAVVSLASDASAQPADAEATTGEVIIIVAPAHSLRSRALQQSPFVSVINSRDHQGESLSVAESLAMMPSVQLRSLGGLGAYSSVSVRGAAAGHTAVLVNGVPLSRIASVTADLGSFSLESFSSVELYRGALPIEIVGGGTGGAVNMTTVLGRQAGQRLRLAVGAGSFGARHLQAWHGDTWHDGKLASSVAASMAQARGDFLVYSDNGTPLVASDDGLKARGHNGYQQVELSTRVGATDTSWQGGLRGMWKSQDLPGSINSPALIAALQTTQLIADAAHTATWDDGPQSTARWQAQHRGYAAIERQLYDDPDNEIGLRSQQRRYLTLSTGAESKWTISNDVHQGTALLQASAERFTDSNAMAADGAAVPASNQRGNRVTIGVGASASFSISPTLWLEPAVRADWMRTAPPPDSNSIDQTKLPVRNEFIPSPRAALRFAASADVAIKSSIGWFSRVPTATELFGDRGFIVGTPTLKVEQGPAAELGAVWASSKRYGNSMTVDQVLIEAVAFAASSHDTIVYITQAGFVAKPINIGNSVTAGAELSATARVAHMMTGTINYTAMHSEQTSGSDSFIGKVLPRHPGHRVYGRIDVASERWHRRMSWFVDGSWHAASFLDQGNLDSVPSRWLLGLGARSEIAAGFSASIDFKNVTNRRTESVSIDSAGQSQARSRTAAIADVEGFPLPGRAVYARLEWAM